MKPQQQPISTPLPNPGRRGFPFRRAFQTAGKWAVWGVALLMWTICMLLTSSGWAQTVVLQTAAGGATVSGPNPLLPTPTYHSGFGNVNGLGIGTPGSGITALSVSGGEFYYTPFSMILAGANPGHAATVKVYITTNFANPSTVLQLMSCPYPGPCGSYANYTAIPTSQAAEITVLPSQTSTGTFTAYLGLLVGDTNGVSVVAPDSVTVMFDVIDTTHSTLTNVQLTLDTPSESVQTAVQLQLGTGSGLAITANGGNPDYTANFGNVNGLGIGPSVGLTIVNGQVANGSLYTTPYLITPAFSGFSSTGGTTITVYSSGFANPTVLKLYDSASSGSGYGLISTSSGSPTTLLTAPSNGNSITRYLGLFVSNVNGAGSFLGSDSAKLTYTITVQ